MRDFIRRRTKEAEDKYKKYKNKLTNIIRTCRKEYYDKILNNNKNKSLDIAYGVPQGSENVCPLYKLYL